MLVPSQAEFTLYGGGGGDRAAVTELCHTGADAPGCAELVEGLCSATRTGGNVTFTGTFDETAIADLTSVSTIVHTHKRIPLQ